VAHSSYLKAITEAERDLEELRKEQAAILHRIEALENFIQSGRVLAGPKSETRRSANPPSARSEGETPIADQVAAILKAAGKPLHLKDIVERARAMRRFSGKDPAASVAIAIKRRGRQFKKVRPNTFTLAQ
jgi:HB1, ASXL, restriction endonuclease HTH domain